MKLSIVLEQYLEDEYADNSMFYELEEFLEQNNVDFRRLSGSSWEFSGCVKEFRKGWVKPNEVFIDPSGNPFLPYTAISAIINNSSGDLKQLDKSIRNVMGLDIPKLTPLTVVNETDSKIRITADRLKKLNMDGRNECAACGEKLSEPWVGIRYCPTCEEE